MFGLRKINGNRVINISDSTKLDYDLAIDAGKEEFRELAESTLEAKGRVIAVVNNGSLKAAYIFGREANSLRLVKEYHSDMDPVTEAKVEAEVRDLIRAVAADGNIFSSDHTGKIYFRDEVLREDTRSLILSILFFLIMINILSAGHGYILLFVMAVLFLLTRSVIRGKVF